MEAKAYCRRRIRLFGHPSFECEGQLIALSLSKKSQALLVLLAANCGRELQRSWLAARLWPDDGEDAARTNLRRHLYLIAKAVGDDALELTRQTARLVPAGALSVDVAEFDEVANHSPEQAISIYSGELAAGIDDPAIDDLRVTYAERYIGVLRVACARARESGDDERLLLLLGHLCAHDRLDESAARELMTVRYRMGDRSGALRDYAALEARLRAELDVEPEAQTTELYDRLLAADIKIDTPTNLPASASSFVGREHELQSLAFALRSHRVVTICGPGGIGKTRLAIELARAHLRRFPDGIWFADLVQARDERDVYERIAAAAGVIDMQEPRASLAERLTNAQALIILDNCEHLVAACASTVGFLLERTSAHVLVTSRRRLEVDGEYAVTLEALALPEIDAPPDKLLRSPAIKLFLERAARVTPDLRVRHENAHSFAEIVRRLDGLPLALELVASRANLLTIEGIAKRLGETLRASKARRDDARHRTVESATQWSYDLLSEAERRVFEICGVFSGSWTLLALEAAMPDGCGDGFAELSELVESSLVQTQLRGDYLRYRLLETTRTFARERLCTSGDWDRASAAHAHHYATTIEELFSLSDTPQEASYFLAIDEEYANVRSGLEYALETDTGLAAKFIASLYRYWALRGRTLEGWAAVESCRRRSDFDALPQPLRGRFFQAAGVLARELGQTDTARALLSDALGAMRAVDDRRGTADVLWAQGKLELNAGNYEVSRTAYRACLPIYSDLGEHVLCAGTTANIGSVSHALKDLAEAKRCYEQALEEYRRLGYLRGLGFIYRQLSLLQQNTGETEAAFESARHSVAISAEIGDFLREADALVILANALADCGHANEALEANVRALQLLERSNNGQLLMLATESLARTAQIMGADVESVRLRASAEFQRTSKNLPVVVDYRREIDDDIARLRGRLSAEAFAAAWAAGESMTPHAILDAARSIQKRHS